LLRLGRARVRASLGQIDKRPGVHFFANAASMIPISEPCRKSNGWSTEIFTDAEPPGQLGLGSAISTHGLVNGNLTVPRAMKATGERCNSNATRPVNGQM
jgi:hypothetical protein